MNTIWQWFWEAVIVGCLLWYTIATVYIAIRGVADLKGMLARLKTTTRAPPPICRDPRERDPVAKTGRVLAVSYHRRMNAYRHTQRTRPMESGRNAGTVPRVSHANSANKSSTPSTPSLIAARRCFSKPPQGCSKCLKKTEPEIGANDNKAKRQHAKLRALPASERERGDHLSRATNRNRRCHKLVRPNIAKQTTVPSDRMNASQEKLVRGPMDSSHEGRTLPKSVSHG